VLVQVTDSNLWAPPSLVTKCVKNNNNVDVTVKKGNHGGSTPSKIGTVKGVSQGVTRDVKGQRSAHTGPSTWNRGRAPLQEGVNVDRLLIPLTVNCFGDGLVLEGGGVHAPGQRGEEDRGDVLIGLKQATYCVYATCHVTVKMVTGKAMTMVVPSHMDLNEIQHRACLYFNLCQTIVKMVLLNTVTMTSAVRSGETLLRECEYVGRVVLQIILRICGGGMGGCGGGQSRPGGINTTSSLEASRDDGDGSADLVNSVFIGSVKPTPQQDPNWHANMTTQDVNAQLKWQGDWDVLERKTGDLIVVFLNSTGRMTQKWLMGRPIHCQDCHMQCF